MHPLSAEDKIESPGRPKQVEFPGESQESTEVSRVSPLIQLDTDSQMNAKKPP